MNDETKSTALPDAFDRALAQFKGRPGVLGTKSTIIRAVPTLGVGGSQTFVVQTWRAPDKDERSRDTILLEAFSADGHVRLVLGYEVADAIARQRDALTTKARRRAGLKNAEERKARGERPAFLAARKEAK